MSGSEIVVTAGRPMSAALQRALDDVTGSARAAAVVALGEAVGGPLAAVNAALAMELRLCALREADTIAGLESSAAADVVPGWSEPPWPSVSGVAGVFDPETGRYCGDGDGLG